MESEMIYMTFVSIFLAALMLWQMWKAGSLRDKLDEIIEDNKRLRGEILNYCERKQDLKIKVDASEVIEMIERRIRTWNN